MLRLLTITCLTALVAAAPLFAKQTEVEIGTLFVGQPFHKR